MTIHFRQADARASFPFPPEEPHARARDMAKALAELSAGGLTGVNFTALLGAGFTAAEITEHFPAAQRLVAQDIVDQVRPQPDLIADMVDKAIAGVPNRPPLPRGGTETQALLLAWRNYCTALAALKLDPWPAQRERAIGLLGLALDRAPAGEAVRREIIARTAETLKGLVH